MMLVKLTSSNVEEHKEDLNPGRYMIGKKAM